MSFYDEHCRGCAAHTYERCSLKPEYGVLKCPCTICLIKGMCRVDCDAIQTYSSNVRDSLFKKVKDNRDEYPEDI